jgi:putative sigma-54 modulation protein
MKLHIRFRDLESNSELKDLVVRRVRFALSRFTHAIRNINVTLADVNGPRGGVDKVCRVRIVGPQLGLIVVEETANEVPAALDGAVGRVARTAARTLERRRILAASA